VFRDDNVANIVPINNKLRIIGFFLANSNNGKVDLVMMFKGKEPIVTYVIRM
jgi:hypothetical protein